MAEELNLGYDMFAEIMKARDIQAENMAKAILNFGEAVYFTSDSYKPKVKYTNGSYSLLVQDYIVSLGGEVATDPSCAEIIVIVHQGDTVGDDVQVPKEVVYFDPWRTYKSDTNEVVHYGNTRMQ